MAVSNGFVYAATFGAGNPGTVISVPTTPGGTQSAGPVFTNHADTSGLINDNGTIIGLTGEGGDAGDGTLFSVNTTTLAVSPIASFSGGSIVPSNSGASLMA